jgi:hypothetical protein
MSQDSPTAPELVVLEILDALGGQSSYGVIKGTIRKQLRPYLRGIVNAMLDQGWLAKSFIGQYAMTEHGRQALRRSRTASAA